MLMNNDLCYMLESILNHQNQYLDNDTFSKKHHEPSFSLHIRRFRTWRSKKTSIFKFTGKIENFYYTDKNMRREKRERSSFIDNK